LKEREEGQEVDDDDWLIDGIEPRPIEETPPEDGRPGRDKEEGKD
jgi:hypothetical protein